MYRRQKYLVIVLIAVVTVIVVFATGNAMYRYEEKADGHEHGHEHSYLNDDGSRNYLYAKKENTDCNEKCINSYCESGGQWSRSG